MSSIQRSSFENTAGPRGLARELLLHIVESDHTLLLSGEMLYELARVLRYPRMQTLFGLSEERIYDYAAFLRFAAEMVKPNPLLFAPIRDLNDTVVIQTAVIGEADVLCTNDRDFFEPPAQEFLSRAGIEVLDDVELMRRLREATSQLS